LGTIPDQYDVAVTTSSGTLNNMVVDTVEQAQACIDLLRKHNVGRASFLMLDKLPHNPGMNPMQTPENVPRLFDLIKPKEPRFAPAFYKAVFNTVVAKDLEQANRIAFGGAKRWRVVTIAGALIDTSGAMSGGGGAPRGGGMSSKLAPDTVSPQVLRQYEQDSEKAARDLQVVQERFKEVEGEVEQLRTVVPQIQMTISKIELDLRNGEQRINEASKRVRDLK
jgi:structural maintenance of chromosome 4